MKGLKFLFIILLTVGIIGCQRKEESNQTALKQSKSDLLNKQSKAICYSGYRSGQHPDRGDGAVNPGYEEVLEDLNILTHNSTFNLIRVYDSGKNTEMVLQVVEDNGLNIKVLLGIWLRAELSTHKTCEWLTEPIPDEILQMNKELNNKEINKGIELANKYEDIIIAVNVGNEALVDWNDHKVSPDTMISYVEKVKKSIEQPVTVAENYKWWADYGSELAKVVDFISIHTYPLWEGKDIDEGMAYTIENVLEVRNALPDAKLVISEAGWATTASEFGNRASEEKQKQYYEELMNWASEMNITTFFFEAFDEDWKGDPNNMMGAEKHWGLFTVDRKPKKVMKKQYSFLTEDK